MGTNKINKVSEFFESWFKYHRILDKKLRT